MQVSNKAQPIKSSPPKPAQGIRLGKPESSEQSPVLVLNPDCPLDTVEIQGQHQVVGDVSEDEVPPALQELLSQIGSQPLEVVLNLMIISVQRSLSGMAFTEPSATEILTLLGRENDSASQASNED